MLETAIVRTTKISQLQSNSTMVRERTGTKESLQNSLSACALWQRDNFYLYGVVKPLSG
jgi:hypothetical protein